MTMLQPGAVCQIKGVFTNCGTSAIAQCVYCGRTFCGKHGVVMEDGFEVCSRKECMTKRQDLEAHLGYKAFVLERNLQRLCGLEVCVTEIQVQCNRCKGYFCIEHTQPWHETVTDKPERTCTHCLVRRSIWSRE